MFSINRSLAVGALVALLILAAIPANADAALILSVEDKTVPAGGGTFTLPVNIQGTLTYVYAYEGHVTITPLDGQPPGSMWYVSGSAADKFFPGKTGSVSSPVQVADGMGITMLGNLDGVAGGNEKLLELTFGYNAAAFGDYQIDLKTSTSFLVGHVMNGNLYSISFTADPGTVTVPEPATLALLALGGLAMIRRRRT